MGRLAEVVAPGRLGSSFRWLLASAWTTNAGDGIALAAGPLLVASLTRDAALVALAATVQWLPPLLFGLVAGALTDRLDRRLIVVGVDLARAAVLAALTTAVVTEDASIAVVLAVLFVLSTAEVFADNSSQALLPVLVAREDLAVANARLQAGFLTLDQLAGPPWAPRCSPPAPPGPSGRRPSSSCSAWCWSRASSCHRAPATASARPACGRTSRRASAGCCSTRRCAPSC